MREIPVPASGARVGAGGWRADRAARAGRRDRARKRTVSVPHWYPANTLPTVSETLSAPPRSASAVPRASGSRACCILARRRGEDARGEDRARSRTRKCGSRWREEGASLPTRRPSIDQLEKIWSNDFER